MQAFLSFIKTELHGLYPPDEIRGFLFRILESVCDMDRQSVLLGKDKQLSSNQKNRILKIVEDLKNYRPIQYILGETEFYGLGFELTEAVLIPRPETEELVEWITHSISIDFPEKFKNSVRVLDIGTGSGCIAIALAKTNPDTKLSALDFSDEILETVRRNAKLNAVKIDFICMDILKEEPEGCWDIIVSNPPYIVPSEKKQMHPNVLQYEPSSALFVPEENPLLFYDRIADLGKKILTPGGVLFFEINPLFNEEMHKMLQIKSYRHIEMKKDLAGKNRMIKAVL